MFALGLESGADTSHQLSGVDERMRDRRPLGAGVARQLTAVRLPMHTNHLQGFLERSKSPGGLGGASAEGCIAFPMLCTGMDEYASNRCGIKNFEYF